MTWLLLRGLMREARHWGAFPQKIESELGDKVVCLDLPGFGDQAQKVSPSKISEIVEQVRAQWLVERGEGPYGILAMSLGGMVALDWQERYPNDFDEAVILASSTLKDGLPFERLRPWGIKKVLNIATKTDLEKKEKVVLELISNKTEVHDEVAKAWANYAQDKSPKLTNGLKQIAAATAYPGPKKLNTRALFLAGHGDKMVNPKCTVKMANRLGADYCLHPWAGHEVSLDDSDWIIEKIRDWRLKK